MDRYDRTGVIAVRTATATFFVMIATLGMQYGQAPTMLWRVWAWVMIAAFFTSLPLTVLSFYAHGWRRWWGVFASCATILGMMLVGIAGD